MRAQAARNKANQLEKISMVGRELLNKHMAASPGAKRAIAADGDDDADSPSALKRSRPADASVMELSGEDKAVDDFMRKLVAIPLDSIAADEALQLVSGLVASSPEEFTQALRLTA